MALLPLYHRDLDWDLSPWRESTRWNDFTIAGFQDRFRNFTSRILQDMDHSVIRMDEDMRRMMQSMGSGKLPFLGISSVPVS